MTPSDRRPIDWDDLLKWYLSADQVMSDLDTSCTVVQSISSGTAVANLRSAEILGGVTHDAERWLMAHPCPEDWNASYLLNIVQKFVDIGELIVSVGGIPSEAASDSLAQLIKDACELVCDVHQVIDRLTIEPPAQPTLTI